MAKNQGNPAPAPEGEEKLSEEKQSEAVEKGAEILRKITPKDVIGGNLTDMVLDGTIKLPCDLYSLIGRAGNLRDGESSFGPWTALLGEFEAARLYDGSNALFYAPQAFVPGPAGELLTQAVRKFVQEPIDVSPEQYKKSGRTYKVTGEFVELAVIVGAKRAERTGGAPYEFTIRPVVDVRKADALAHLRAKMTQAALPSPKK